MVAALALRITGLLTEPMEGAVENKALQAAELSTCQQALFNGEFRLSATAVRKTIIFVRHGESEYNKAIRQTGKDPLIRDAPLTETGRLQAARARKTLTELREVVERRLPSSDQRRWALLVSPLRRALDTAAGVWPEAFFQGAASADSTVAADGGSNVRLEIWPALRETISGMDDLGSSPRVLMENYPHLWPQLISLPDVWWTVPSDLQYLPADGDAMREVYMRDPDAFEDAEDAVIHGRLQALARSLAQVPEELVVVVSHCDLVGQLTQLLGLTEGPSFRPGWWLSNCECRVADGLKLLQHKAPSEEVKQHKKLKSVDALHE